MTTIHTFGHYWSRDLVNWNYFGRGERGSLKGYRGKGKNRHVVDFRNQIGIYVLYAESREVIYVGQAGRGNRKLWRRLKSHTRSSLRSRWTHFSWFGLLAVDADTSALQADFISTHEGHIDHLDEIEAILIQLFEPRLNWQRSKWRDSKEYLQFDEKEDKANVTDDDEIEDEDMPS